jgi:hypothetical protein
MKHDPRSPSTQTTLSTAQHGTTPFPNFLLDGVMPTLRDTEWRVLCVVVRQTRGWRDPQTGRRKQSDWLTHRQLQRRTGRASAAVCRAIDSLVHLELIEVRDELGKMLPTADDRRRSGRRLYYRLHPACRPGQGN